MSGKIILATALAVTLASTAAASATVKKHKHYMRGATYGQTHNKMGHPGSYGSPGNMTPGYSSTARHKPTDTNGGGGGSGQ